MRKPTYCPRCDDDLLAVIWEKEQTRIRCAECGWSYTFAPPPHSDALDAAIARVVDATNSAAARVNGKLAATDSQRFDEVQKDL